MKSVFKYSLLSFLSLMILSGCSLFYKKNQYDYTQYYMLGSLEYRLAKRNLSLGDPVFIRIFKEESRLEVWMQPNQGRQYQLFGVYPICKYSGGLGPKLYEGDKQAPEGFYAVSKQGMNPNSQFYKSFNLGFPNAYDQAHGRTGSYLMVHGDCISIGCYAMTDRQMDEIFLLSQAALNNGQPYFRVHIFPFELTKQRLDQAKNNRWYGFWKELEPVYQAFEQTHIPPVVNVVNQRYQIQK